MTNAASKQAGFTLMELMITVAIVAILSTIAYGSYSDQVTRSRRAAAGACLLERAQFMERYYTTNMTYVGAPDPLPACDADVASHYGTPEFSGAVTQNAYTLQIVPTGSQEANDTKCATLQVDSRGTRSATGTASATPAECW
ncbi:type IV pilin protein [Pseudoxanthomonas indica]|uniref:Type IV pilus assembly protein PilE n=1 Tax=Pseudoxanthomonas indica TaxID=428993 RepID=A0A1T5JGR0_9GAMM|nr:type IV pilin protein [Pseudoxanthomonas indica]GGD58672.1 hypothetical protein GCM10007235_33730 [Pseudoxanthomonas indica]SKC50630.1 type IV pilus assembly protein PilE [Pseudoxanthomonas indica]